MPTCIQGEGTLLATGSYDGQARIWTTNGKSLQIILFMPFYILQLKATKSILLNQPLSWCSYQLNFSMGFLVLIAFSFIKLLVGYPIKIRGLFLFLTEFVTLLAFYNYIVICFWLIVRITHLIRPSLSIISWFRWTKDYFE